MLYIKLIIQHIMILSGAQRNLTIVFLYKCSPYTSNINVQNHHSFWSYDKNFLSLNPKYEKIIIFVGSWGFLTSNLGLPKFQGRKTSSQSRYMYNRGKNNPQFFIYINIWTYGPQCKKKFIIQEAIRRAWVALQ